MTEVAAAVILPRFTNLRREDVRAKSHAADLVTVADEEAERLLTPRLEALVPGSRVVGEEGVAAGNVRLDALAGEDPVWIVDPIDGTANFVNGIERFAVMVALVVRGETVAGWIHDPLGGATLAAERGAGTWHRAADGTATKQKARSSPHLPAEMVVALHHKDFARVRGRFARNVRQGSAAHDYWALSDGRLHALAYRRLKPWDHAAGVLIHGESGGHARLLSGAPYRPSQPDQEGLLCAASAEMWDLIAAMVRA
jgi:fructose-1,6-bisphosphatase/inositol monophosphatase family enzyme